MSARTLLRGGHIISMDPDVGDIPGGDVLIEDEDIAEVAPSIDASDSEVIDASGAIIIPGFIDSHRHTWETVLRVGPGPPSTSLPSAGRLRRKPPRRARGDRRRCDHAP